MALWTPAYMTTTLWLDASDSENFTLDGSNNVTQWDDLSGNDNHAVQSGTNSLPSYNSTDDSVDFDGTEILETPNSLASLGNVEAFIVGRYTQNQTNVAYLLAGTTSGLNHRFFPAQCESGSSGNILFAIGTTDNFGSRPTRDNNSHIYSMSHNGTSAKAFDNGAEIGSATRNYTGTPTLWSIGGVGSSPRLQGKIYEIILLSSVLSIADRKKVEGYLAWKWGLEGNLPSDHEYKDAAPTLPHDYIDLPPFSLGLAVASGDIIGDAFTILPPLSLSLSIPPTPVSQSIPTSSMELGISMDFGDAFMTRYVPLAPLNMGLFSTFGNVSQAVALASMDMGLDIDGSVIVSIPLKPFSLGLASTFGNVSSFETGSAIIRYFCILTGAADGTTDLTLPMKSFQARRRSGDPTYLSVVVPTVDYADEIAARPNGTLKIQQAYEQNGVIKQVETIMETDLESVNPDEGGTNKSVTLVGYSTATYAPKDITLSGVTYRSTRNGKYHYRLARPYIFLNPGDTVTCSDDGVTFVVGTMSYFINSVSSIIELASSNE